MEFTIPRKAYDVYSDLYGVMRKYGFISPDNIRHHVTGEKRYEITFPEELASKDSNNVIRIDPHHSLINFFRRQIIRRPFSQARVYLDDRVMESLPEEPKEAIMEVLWKY